MFRKHLYTLLFLALVTVCAQTAHALPADYYTKTSKLAAGKWVKIKVTDTGMQELSFARLKEMGFSDPSKVAVYGYPGTTLRFYNFSTQLPDDLPAVPSAVYDDKLVFYGVGADEAYARVGPTSSTPYVPVMFANLENTESYYFLTDSAPRMEVAVTDAAVSADFPAVEKAYGVAWHNYKDVHGGVGAYLMSRNLLNEPEQKLDCTFHLPAYDTSSLGTSGQTKDRISVALRGVFRGNTSGVTFSINGSHTEDVWQFYASTLKYLAYQLSGVRVKEFTDVPLSDDGNYTLSFVPYSQLENTDMLALDYVALTYPRTTDVSDGAQHQLFFRNLSAGEGVKLSGATATTRVWKLPLADIPEALTVKKIDEDGALGVALAEEVYMPHNAPGCRLMVFDPAQKLLEPELVGEVANQDYHSLATPDMLIVSSELAFPQAERLAELHKRYTGLDVAVVPFNRICNEFSSGLSHTMAIRRLAKKLFDQEAGKLKAILLFGRAPRDNSGVSSTDTPEQFDKMYVPMFQCQDSVICGETPKSYATDALYAMLTDGFVLDSTLDSEEHLLKHPFDVAIGRIPAADAAEAADYVDKVEKYLTSTTDKPMYNRAMISADFGDANTHLLQGLVVRTLIEKESPSTTPEMNLVSLYSGDGSRNLDLRARIDRVLKRGIGYWIYMGHSIPSSSICRELWSVLTDRELVNELPPFVVFATCETLPMDSPENGLQTSMLFNKKGGMMAGVGASRSVYAEYNFATSIVVTRAFYNASPVSTFGQVYKLSRDYFLKEPQSIGSTVADNQLLHVNMLSFNLAGDPMLPVHAPSRNIEITSIDGIEVPTDTITFNPLKKYHLEGRVFDADGNTDTSFNGTLTMTVYDGRHTVSTKVTADKDNPAMDIVLADKLLQEVKATVVNGVFASDVVFAAPSYIGMGNAINLYAINDDHSERAVGALQHVEITNEFAADGGITEITAPEITSMYAVSPDFADGDLLPASFNLYATISAGDLALLVSSDRFGSAATLTLDDRRSLAGADGLLQADSDGNATLCYPVSGLADGQHKLTLKVVNVAGESAVRSIRFHVVNVADANLIVTNEEGNPDALVRQSAEIGIDLVTGQQITGRVVVTAADGNVVFTKKNVTLPYVWDLKDSEGAPVADGVYDVKVYFRAGQQHGASAPARIIVGR